MCGPGWVRVGGRQGISNDLEDNLTDYYVLPSHITPVTVHPDPAVIYLRAS